MRMRVMSEIQTLIDKYQLEAHPEGGYYREEFRSLHSLSSPVHGKKRDSLSHIYFLLTKGQVSRFHKVLHDEIWNWYEGAPLRLLKGNLSRVEEIHIGPGEKDYYVVVPAGEWQAAESTGKYTLLGCSVAPGFNFSDFSFMNEEEKARALTAGIDKRFL